MSGKRRRRRTGRRAPEAPAEGTASSHPRHALAVLTATVVGAGVVVTGAIVLARAPVVLPPPHESTSESTVRRSDFVGAERCADCHAREFAAWRISTHGTAGGSPAPSNVIAPFDGTPLRFRDATVTPRRSSTGGYEFVIARDGGQRVLAIDGVIGGGHMAGGGTQGFVTRWADGTLRFLPFDYSRQTHRWFCNTNSRLDHGWVPISAALTLEACGDWPPVRVLGDVARFANCQSCHASQLDVAFDTATHRYATQLTSLAINCESCHGPARRHVEIAESGRIASDADIGMTALGTLDKEQSLRVCFQCHAVKDQLRTGYVSGDSLERYYSLALPSLGDRPLLPDGRVRTFAYQENHRYSDCYLNGGMRCTDCHDPHTQRYRDVDGVPLPGRLDDRQCTGCHASKGDTAALVRHTHHPLQSPGSRCVSCHMPYLQHPEVGRAIRYARADHSIPIPRPVEDAAEGIAPACAACHADRSPALLHAQETRWFGELKPRNAAIRSQLRAADVTGDAAVGFLLDSIDMRPELAFARAAALGRLIDGHLAGEWDLAKAATIARLRTLARDEQNLDAKAMALASLHLARGEEHDTRRFLKRALEDDGAGDAELRDRWALALGYAGDRYIERGRPADAVSAYRKALEIRPERGAIARSLANAERDAGRLADALTDYQRALAGNARDALTLVNMGITQEALGDSLSAMDSWRRASEIDPGEALALFNLANSYLVRGRLTEAIVAYERAVARDESLVPAHVNVARAYAATGRYDEALRAVRRGLRFDSANAGARQLEAQLERAARRGSSRP